MKETHERESSPLVLTQLAEYAPGTLLSQSALADALGVSPRTLRRLVARGEVPQGIRLGGRKVWLAETVFKYLSERAERQARESERQAARLREFLD